MADILYICAISKVIHTLQNRIHQHGLVMSVSVENSRGEVASHSLDPVGYVDDTAYPVYSNACDIVHSTTMLACIAKDTFYEYSMDLNFRPGKSEGLIQWRGKGSVKYRRELETHDNCVECIAKSGKFVLRFSESYKHVGTNTSTSGDLGHEIAIRVPILRSGAEAMRKSIMCNARLPLTKKLHIAQAYIFSKGLFQAGTWPALSVRLYTKMHHAIMYVYRCIAGIKYDPNVLLTDDAVIAEHELICPRTVLRQLRLSLFMRVCRSNHPKILACLIKLVSVQGSWSHSVFEDLRWLCWHESFSSFGVLPFRQWVDRVTEDPKAFKSAMVKVCRHPLSNVSTQWATCKSLASLGQTYICLDCGSVMKSRQALAVHTYKAHGVKGTERKYVDTTFCTICLVQFWDRERVVNHIRYRSPICRLNLLLRGPLMDAAAADALDSKEHDKHKSLAHSGKRRHHARKACIQLIGPLQPIVLQPGTESNHHRMGVGHCYKC
jgi:hypothetical protein